MAVKYLLDTNIIAEPNRIFPNENVVKKLQENQLTVAMSAVSWHELLYGWHRLPESKQKKRIAKYIFQVVAPTIPILPFAEKTAAWFGKERARLEGIGQKPAFADGQIAAIAVANNLVLVTRNEKDFVNFQGLLVENWFE
jgi:tRNA(fMet)-specific endonuclease VapC